MRAPLLFALVLVASTLGCVDNDGDTSPAPPDAAPQIADAATGSTNALGQPCDNSTPCPTSPAHTCVFLNSGNPNVGYCSPVCTTDLQCTTDYTGPQTGEPTCFTPDDPNACSILCGGNNDCPGTMTCIITGGPVNVCATQ